MRRQIVLNPLLEQKEINVEQVPYPAGYLIFSLEGNELGRIPLEFVPKQQSPKSFWHSFSLVIERVVGGIIDG